jgi:hypothetical protein
MDRDSPRIIAFRDAIKVVAVTVLYPDDRRDLVHGFPVAQHTASLGKGFEADPGQARASDRCPRPKITAYEPLILNRVIHVDRVDTPVHFMRDRFEGLDDRGDIRLGSRRGEDAPWDVFHPYRKHIVRETARQQASQHPLHHLCTHICTHICLGGEGPWERDTRQPIGEGPLLEHRVASSLETASGLQDRGGLDHFPRLVELVGDVVRLDAFFMVVLTIDRPFGDPPFPVLVAGLGMAFGAPVMVAIIEAWMTGGTEVVAAPLHASLEAAVA